MIIKLDHIAKYITLLLFILVSFISFSKEEGKTDEFDNIYYDIIINVATHDVEKAMELTDSLIDNSTDQVKILRSLLLKSTLYQRKGNPGYSVVYTENAYAIAKDIKDYAWQARILGSLATTYRIVGLYDEGKEYLEQGKKASKNIKDEKQRMLFTALAMQEDAYYKIVEEKYDEAYSLAEEADNLFQKIGEENNSPYFLANNQELLAQLSVHKNDWPKALYHYTNLKEQTEGKNLSHTLDAFLHSGLAKVYLELDSLPKAIHHLEELNELSENSGIAELKAGMLEMFSIYYKRTGDLESYVKYNEEYQTLKAENEFEKDEFINKFIREIKEKNQELKKSKSTLIIFIISLATLILVLISWQHNRRKKESEKFNKRLAELKKQYLNNTLQPVSNGIEKEVPTEKTNVERESLMPEEAKEKILADLEVFESKQQYLDKNISLAKLSDILKTNSKYTSHIISNYKSRNFNSYINELRIKYIIDKLENEKIYQKYSISYLAEECGFSSHSKFTTVFKSITGYTPSVFIKYLTIQQKTLKQNNLHLSEMES